MKAINALIFLVVLFASCAKPVALVVSYGEPKTGKGSFKVVPSRSIEGTKLVVNNRLLVENDSQRVKSITVKNLPDGINGYQLTCDNSKLKQKLDASNNVMVKGEEEKTFLHEVPPYSTGFWIKEGLENAAAWVALFSLYLIYD